MKKSWTGGDIKAARLLLGKSQVWLGEQLDMSAQNISNMETGNKGKVPTVQTGLAVECLLRRAGQWQAFLNQQNK